MKVKDLFEIVQECIDRGQITLDSEVMLANMDERMEFISSSDNHVADHVHNGKLYKNNFVIQTHF